MLLNELVLNQTELVLTEGILHTFQLETSEIILRTTREEACMHSYRTHATPHEDNTHPPLTLQTARGTRHSGFETWKLHTRKQHACRRKEKMTGWQRTTKLNTQIMTHAVHGSFNVRWRRA